MNYEKKRITKEDGRYLIFYHFPATANPDQAVAFETAQQFDNVPAVPPDGALHASEPNGKSRSDGSDTGSVPVKL